MEAVFGRCSSKYMFLKILQNFIGKHQCWNLFLKTRMPADMQSY